MSNSYQLKIVGTGELPEALEANKSLKIITELDIYSVEKLDNQDSTFTIRYKAKICSTIDVEQGTKHFIAKDPKKASKRLRWALEAKADTLGLDREEYYQSEMNKIIASFKD